MRSLLSLAAGCCLLVTAPAGSHPCPDIDGDRAVGVTDLLAVIEAWGPCPEAPEPCPANVGLNSGKNDVVDVVDLLFVIEHWGECPVK